MAQAGRVILVDDDEAVRSAGRQALELAGFRVDCLASAESLPEGLSRSWPGVVISDIKMPRVDGLTLMRRVLETDPEIPVVLITGHGDVAMAVQAMRDGAYDFIEKPFPSDRLVEVAGRALDRRLLVVENRALRSELEGATDLSAMLLGKTPAMESLRQQVSMLAGLEADVLINGETGSGKELVARALHGYGERAGKPFVAVNCGAIPAEIIESELFGHEPGAFTGATKRRIGKFEYADGGVLFLDEIESMPLDLQVKLLRVLQDRAIERLGSNETIALDLRVLAASKVDLRRACDEGRFREDLYYRLDVVALHLPPLRDRLDDVPLLFQQFLTRAVARCRREPPLVDAATVAELLSYDWPGNVRELQNAAERFALGLGGPVVAANGGGLGQGRAVRLSERVEAFEKTLIAQALAHHGGNVTATCEALAVPRKTLYDKMSKHGLSRDDALVASGSQGPDGGS